MYIYAVGSIRIVYGWSLTCDKLDVFAAEEEGVFTEDSRYRNSSASGVRSGWSRA